MRHRSSALAWQPRHCSSSTSRPSKPCRSTPNDDMIVVTAVAARADYLVTGDRRQLIVLEHYEGIRILSPRAFFFELAPDQA
jgi:predicted nucleic acid-binding protein